MFLLAACWQVLAAQRSVSRLLPAGSANSQPAVRDGSRVAFAQWTPSAPRSRFAFGALHRLILDIQGPLLLFGFDNPFYYNSYLGFFLQMLPYAFTVIVLVIGSREAIRKRIGAPAALGEPYIRGERGK
jgi:simple sugar transport system permease protein